MLICDTQPIVINTEDGIEAVINKLNSLARTGDYVFRGYGKQDELLPNIIREKDYTRACSH